MFPIIQQLLHLPSLSSGHVFVYRSCLVQACKQDFADFQPRNSSLVFTNVPTLPLHRFSPDRYCEVLTQLPGKLAHTDIEFRHLESNGWPRPWVAGCAMAMPETFIVMFHLSYHSSIIEAMFWNFKLEGRPFRLSKACGVDLAGQPTGIQRVLRWR
jgi:hypothetical protein